MKGRVRGKVKGGRARKAKEGGRRGKGRAKADEEGEESQKTWGGVPGLGLHFFGELCNSV